MVPVNITEDRFDDKGLQVTEELTKPLVRPKHIIVLIMAGVEALIILMATIATADIALSQSVQTAHFVYNLSRNVSMTLHTQKDCVQL